MSKTSKPFWSSTGFWGSCGSIAMAIMALLHVQITPENQWVVLALSCGIGLGFMALSGRINADSRLTLWSKAAPSVALGDAVPNKTLLPPVQPAPCPDEVCGKQVAQEPSEQVDLKEVLSAVAEIREMMADKSRGAAIAGEVRNA